MKRLNLYFFYDEDGIVDDYILFFLERLKAQGGQIWVVVNGHITPEGQAKLTPFVDNILLRENTGLDAYAYRYALEAYGYDKIKDLDEVIVSNFTYYGPIYPFDEMFNAMADRDCDFWAVTRHPKKHTDGSLLLHIQSYFVVYKKSLLQSDAFREYWDTLPEINSYADSVNRHELRQTPFFHERGFKSDGYVDITPYVDDTQRNAVIWRAQDQLINERSPLLKRRVFYLIDGVPTAPGLGEIIQCIQEKSTYDLRLIYDNLVRTQNLDALWNNTQKHQKKRRKRRIMQFLMPWRRKKYQKKIDRDTGIIASTQSYRDFLTSFRKA